VILEFGLLSIGLVLLYLGSEFLVRGAASTAILLSVKPVIVGLTVISFATSAPELLVSLVAAVNEAQGISVGNILGSNVINIALVLGICAVIKPVHINGQILKFEMPFMVTASIIFGLLCIDGYIGFFDGAVLIFLLALFLGFGIANSREKGNNSMDKDRSFKRFSINAVMIIGGILGLAKGADMVVQSAIFMARSIGLSEAFIGISVVALGTSLPELAASAVAASKGESDLSLGNIVGSNLFNICLVMGVVGLLNPMQIDKALMHFKFPFMIFICVMLYGVALLKNRIDQKTGAVFILLFIVYIVVSYYK